jgi:hypothetical protein
VPFILFRLDFNDFDAFIVATRGADLMGQAKLMTIGAWNQISSLERMMTAPPALAALAQLVFW